MHSHLKKPPHLWKHPHPSLQQLLPHPAFSADKVLEVPSISALVGEGTIHFMAGDDAQTLKMVITGKMPIVNGNWCLTCLDTVKIDPDIRVETRLFVEIPAPKPVAGLISDYMSMSNTILSSPIHIDATEFIVAGPEGATLTKVGRGFLLVKGSAYLLDTTKP